MNHRSNVSLNEKVIGKKQWRYHFSFGALFEEQGPNLIATTSYEPVTTQTLPILQCEQQQLCSMHHQ